MPDSAELCETARRGRRRRPDGHPCEGELGLDSYELLVRSHPAHQLTIRNSRSGLEALGYRFPERDLRARSSRSRGGGRLLRRRHDYLDAAYGEVEKAIDPDGRHANGFAKSSYHQRLVSSLHACRVSLTRRLNRIEAVVGGLERRHRPRGGPG
jgi:hypothetical protein